MSNENSQRTGTLGRGTLLAMGIGCVVGAGVVTLVGRAIGMTGHSAWLAYGLAVIMGFLYNMPMVYASGALRMDGGPYALISTILGKKYAGIYVVSFFLYFPSVALYAVALGQYVQSLLPTVPVNVTAVIVLTIFYLINLRGVGALAKFQNVMTSLLIVGLGTLVIMGMSKVNFALLSPANPDFMPAGPQGLFAAACLLMFSTYCQYYLMFFSRHAKNPKKDIPFAMLGTSATIAVLYIAVTAVASGVLPIEVVANQPLTYVAQEILSTPLFIFFMIAAPLMALSTTINSCYAGYVEPLFTATMDGWFPKKFGSTNKYGNPWIILTILWLASMIPIALGWDIGTIANAYLLADLTLGVFMIVAIAQIPKKYPKAWANREYGKKHPQILFTLSIVLAGTVQAIIIFNSITSIELYIVIATAIAFITGVVYAIKKEKDNSVNTPVLDIDESA